MKLNQPAIILFLLACFSQQLTAPISISSNQRYINTGVCTLDTSKTYNNASAAKWDPITFTIAYPANFNSNNGLLYFLSIKDLHVAFNNRTIQFYGFPDGNQTDLVISIFSNLTSSISSLSYQYLFIANQYNTGNIVAYFYQIIIDSDIYAPSNSMIIQPDQAVNALNMTGGITTIVSFLGFDLTTSSDANVLDLAASGEYNPTNLTVILSTNSTVHLTLRNIYVSVLAFNKDFYNRPKFAAFYTQYHTLQGSSYTFTNISYLYQPTTVTFFNLINIQGSSFLDLKTQFNSPDNITFTTSNLNSTFVFTYINMLTYYCKYTTPYYYASESICYDLCPVGTYTDLYTLSCLSCSYDCYTCNNNRTCLACNPIVHHRILNTSTSRCVPMQGYYQTNATVCGSCAADCAYCSSDKVCTNCTLGYYLNSSACVSCSVNCTSCSSANLCTICASGYFFNGSACPSCPANCGSCSSNSSCKNCTQGYYLSSNGSCQSCLLNCISCTSNGLCQYCEPGYYLSNTSTCESCTTNCNRCSSGSSCQLCAVGYFVSNGSCQGCSNNCVTCFSVDLCQNCAVGYYLSAISACLACPAGCHSCSSSSSCNTSTSSSKLWLLIGVSIGLLLLVIIALIIVYFCWRRKVEDQSAATSERVLNNAEMQANSLPNYQTNIGFTTINLIPLSKPQAITRTRPMLTQTVTGFLTAQGIAEQASAWQDRKSQAKLRQQLCGICKAENACLQLACGHLFHVKCLADSSQKGNCVVCWQNVMDKNLKVYCQGCKMKEKLIPLGNVLKLQKQSQQGEDIFCQNCVNKSS